MLRNQSLELTDDVGVSAESQERIDPLLARGQVELLKPRNLALGERLEAEVCEWRAAPQGERLAELQLGCSRIAAGPRLPCVGPQTFEAVEVELVPCQIERVPRRTCDEQRLSFRLEELAQARDVDLQRLPGGLRRLGSPERIDETVGGDRLVGVQDEDSQQ